MEKERWQSYPAATPQEKLFLALVGLAGAPRTTAVTVEGPAGKRTMEVRQELRVEGPIGERGEVVSRIEYVGPGLDEGEHVVENLWDLASSLLDEAEEHARALEPHLILLPEGADRHNFETVIDLTHEDRVLSYGVPKGAQHEVEQAAKKKPRPARAKKTAARARKKPVRKPQTAAKAPTAGAPDKGRAAPRAVERKAVPKAVPKAPAGKPKKRSPAPQADKPKKRALAPQAGKGRKRAGPPATRGKKAASAAKAVRKPPKRGRR